MPADTMTESDLLDYAKQYGLRVTPPSGNTALSIASSAEGLQPQRQDYGGYCERYVCHSVRDATGRTDIHGVNLSQNAIDVMKEAQRKGVGFAYDPNTPLQPGDIAYSGRMGNGYGHAMIAGRDRRVRSDLAPGVGQDKIDWVIRPDAPSGGAGAQSGASTDNMSEAELLKYAAYYGLTAIKHHSTAQPRTPAGQFNGPPTPAYPRNSPYSYIPPVPKPAPVASADEPYNYRVRATNSTGPSGSVVDRTPTIYDPAKSTVLQNFSHNIIHGTVDALDFGPTSRKNIAKGIQRTGEDIREQFTPINKVTPQQQAQHNAYINDLTTALLGPLGTPQGDGQVPRFAPAIEDIVGPPMGVVDSLRTPKNLLKDLGQFTHDSPDFVASLLLPGILHGFGVAKTALGSHEGLVARGKALIDPKGVTPPPPAIQALIDASMGKQPLGVQSPSVKSVATPPAPAAPLREAQLLEYAKGYGIEVTPPAAKVATATVPEKPSAPSPLLAPKNMEQLVPALMHAYDIPHEQAVATAALENARARQWATEAPWRTVEDWYAGQRFGRGDGGVKAGTEPPAVSASPAQNMTAKEATVPGASDTGTLFQSHNPQVDDLGFYSHAERVIDQNPQKTWRADQLRSYLNSKGVKPDEMHWSGLNDFLDSTGDKPIAKDDIIDHLRQNNVQLTEVVKGSRSGVNFKYGSVDEYQKAIFDAERRKDWESAEQLTNELHDWGGGNDATKYGQYQIPGGENYREMLLTLPTKDMHFRSQQLDRYNQAMSDLDNAGLPRNATPFQISEHYGQERANEIVSARMTSPENVHLTGQDDYISSHWDEPNVLAHIRMSDRTGPNGEKILHVDEIQSDWHQLGRKEGYSPGENSVVAAANAYDETVRRIASNYGVDGSDTTLAYRQMIDNPRVRVTDKDALSAVSQEWKEVSRRQNDGVPVAPFSKTWHELAAKRVLRYASDHGYDKVAWTKGEEQGARYPEDNGGPIDQARVQGMKGFYDKILPDTFNKLGKRFGARVGKVSVKTGTNKFTQSRYEGPRLSVEQAKAVANNHRDFDATATNQMRDVVKAMEQGQSFEDAIEYNGSAHLAESIGGKMHIPREEFTALHSVDITPEMRKSLTAEGQPLFQGKNKGSIKFRNDGIAIRRGLASPDLSTALHEMGHAMRRSLPDADLKALEDHYGVAGGKWERSHEERFAGNFERYLHDGNAPTSILANVFAKLKAWMGDIYRSIKGTPLEEEVHPVVKGVLDRAFGKEPGATEPIASPPKVPDSSKYAGSINTRLFRGDSEAINEVRQTAERLGMVGKGKVTDAQTRELGKSLGLSYADMEKMQPGHYPSPPPGIQPAVWYKSYWDAVRNLHAQSKVDLGNAKRTVRESLEEHEDNPSSSTQKSLDNANIAQGRAQQNSDMMQTHDDESARVAGVVLQGRNRESIPIKGEGYQSKLASTPTLDEALAMGRGAVKPVSEGPVRPSVPRPARVRTISDSDVADAISQLKASGGAKSVVPTVVAPQKPNVLFQRAIEDDPTEALVTIGKYHLEGGARQYPEWKVAVEKSIGEKLPDDKAQYTYSLARHDLAKTIKDKQTEALEPIFVDQLSHELGVKGAAKFLQDIGPEMRNKLIRGDKAADFTADEQKEMARQYDINQPDRRKGSTKHAQTTAKQIAHDASAPQRKADAKARALAKRDNIPVTDELTQILARRIGGGLKSAEAIRADLNNDTLGKSAIQKLQDGEELTNTEGRRLARAIDAFKRTAPVTIPSELTRRITSIITDARRGRLGYDSPKEAARAQLITDANQPLNNFTSGTTDAQRAAVQEVVDKRIAAITRDLDAVDDNDHAGIARAMMRHSTLGDQYQQYILGNILSGWDTGEKILNAHYHTVAAEEMRRWLFGDKSETLPGIGAGLKAVRETGIPEANRILKEGSTAAHLAGKSWYRAEDSRIPVESKLPLHRAVLRAHSAFYHIMQTYNVERGLHLYAAQDGRALGLKGVDLKEHINEVALHPERYRILAEKAIKFGAEETQTEANKVAQAINKAAGRHPIARGVKNMILPVANLPLNAMKRSMEMQLGLLANRQTARLLAGPFYKLHPEATPADFEAYRKKVFHRGVIGVGITGIGAAGSVLGIITPNDEHHGRYSARVKLPFGKSIDVPAGNVGAMMDIGSSVQHDIATHDYSQITRQLLAPTVEENPLGRALETLSGLYDTATGNTKDAKGVNRVIGGVGTEHLPLSGLTGNLASAIDATTREGIRQKGSRDKKPLPVPAGALDYIFNAEPWLRQTQLEPYAPKRPQSVLHISPTLSAQDLAMQDAENKKKEASASGSHHRRGRGVPTGPRMPRPPR